jgi:F0F1-type ATP synthase membrane subunit a
MIRNIIIKRMVRDMILYLFVQLITRWKCEARNLQMKKRVAVAWMEWAVSFIMYILEEEVEEQMEK